MIAGHLEPGETFTQCMIREAREEAGVEVDVCDLKVGCMMHRDSGSPEDNERIDAYFVTTKWKGEIENKESHKCDDLSWFDIDDLPKNTIPCVRKAIENIKNNVFYDEHGWEE
jgi:8-oxo-dGTP pyrophosphatase MutT (NUDIX family)